MAKAAADAEIQIDAYLKAQPPVARRAVTLHFSLVPIAPRLVQSLGKAAEKHETSNKGTIRFPLDEPVPVSLVKRIAKARIAELRQRRK